MSNRYSIFGTRSLSLQIEVSLPKLLFGNNFDELKSKDFIPLIKKLAETLETMGVSVSANVLAKAPVSSIHYSKNTPLTDGSTAYHFINKIKESNIKLSLDINQTDYRNDGYSYKWHCNSYEFVFYDKIIDLEKAKQSSKRSFERDNELQLNLFDKNNFRKKLEILRIEMRLTKRQKMKQLFGKLNIKSDFTFKSLFKVGISKKILLHYLNDLESKRSPLLDYRTANDKALLAELIFSNENLNSKQILQIFGFKKALESVTLRELRNMFANFNKRSWYRLLTDVNKTKISQIYKPFEIMRENLIKFKPLRLNDYKFNKNK